MKCTHFSNAAIRRALCCGLMLSVVGGTASASAAASNTAAPAARIANAADNRSASASGPSAAGDGLGGAAGQLGNSLGKLGGNLGGNLGDSLNRIGSNLGDSLHRFFGNLGVIVSDAGGNYVDPTPGTTSEEGYIQHQGLARRYVLIRPDVAVEGAPVLVLLHAHGLAPERMANLTRAGRLAAEYGVWVYLPEARGGSWNDDPSSITGADDVGFLSQLIDSALREHKLDAQRVYAAGYSNGGFMAERLGCELPMKIAGLAAVAATLRASLTTACANSRPIPVAIFAGTSDPVVPYDGLPGLLSAPATVEFWAARAGCTAGQTLVSSLPDAAPADGTRVTLTHYTGCPATSDIRLYTITGGGHTWPSSVYAGYTGTLGRTSFDIDATTELWRVLTPFSLQATGP